MCACVHAMPLADTKDGNSLCKLHFTQRTAHTASCPYWTVNSVHCAMAIATKVLNCFVQNIIWVYLVFQFIIIDNSLAFASKTRKILYITKHTDVAHTRSYAPHIHLALARLATVHPFHCCASHSLRQWSVCVWVRVRCGRALMVSLCALLLSYTLKFPRFARIIILIWFWWNEWF